MDPTEIAENTARDFSNGCVALSAERLSQLTALIHRACEAAVKEATLATAADTERLDWLDQNRWLGDQLHRHQFVRDAFDAAMLPPPPALPAMDGVDA